MITAIIETRANEKNAFNSGVIVSFKFERVSQVRIQIDCSASPKNQAETNKINVAIESRRKAIFNSDIY